MAKKKTATDYKADERERKRSAGLVLKQIWVKPEDWPKIQKYLARLAR